LYYKKYGETPKSRYVDDSGKSPKKSTLKSEKPEKLPGEPKKVGRPRLSKYVF